MAEETNKEATVEAPEKKPTPKVYLVKSAVRGRTNRTERTMQPGRQRFVQRLAGGAIIVRRARPARITEAALQMHLDVIKKAVAEHKVVVTTPAGQAVDLNTMSFGVVAASKPLPNPPLDSAKNDKNEGVGYEVPATPTGSNVIPELLRGGTMPEGKLLISEPPKALEVGVDTDVEAEDDVEAEVGVDTDVEVEAEVEAEVEVEEAEAEASQVEVAPHPTLPPPLPRLPSPPSRSSKRKGGR